jgi:hypothetical protein
MEKGGSIEIDIIGFYEVPPDGWKEISYEEALEYKDEIKKVALNQKNLLPVACGKGKVEYFDNNVKFWTSFENECKNKIIVKISLLLLSKNKNLFKGTCII